jgi:hypothetical protein
MIVWELMMLVMYVTVLAQFMNVDVQIFQKEIVIVD